MPVSSCSDIKRPSSAPGHSSWAIAYWCSWTLLVSLLFCFVLTSSKPPFFDEPLHLKPALAFDKASSLVGWLNGNDSSAPGPLYALLHYSISLGQGALPVPWVRLPNLLLLCLIFAACAELLKRRSPLALFYASTIVAVPSTWVISGMALTEIPSMMGISVALLAGYALGDQAERGNPIKWHFCLLAGVIVALLGRQTYLVTIPGIWLLACRDVKTAALTACTLALGTVPLLLLVLVWGGFVPPRLANLGSSLQLRHFIIALGYAGAFSFILAPSWFAPRWKLILLSAIPACLLNTIGGAIYHDPLRSLQSVAGLSAFSSLINWGSSQLIVALAAAFFCTIVADCFDNRDRYTIALSWGILSLCASCAGISHQFSSRYIAMATPFLILLISRKATPGAWATLRLLLGGGIGAASLFSYYLAH